ncbi:hypothetical protein BGX26_005562 [Mortierella sp. AD094]|nr:hypothetical protein BGX26_005562 [Mortierella sp. AD094]
MTKSIAALFVLVATLSGALAGFSDNWNMGQKCNTAFNRFNDGTVYNGYTSRVNGNCAAIYRCSGDYPSLTGARLKELFAPIYAGGSHTFNGGSCEVTLGFCPNCLDRGNPN